MDNFIYAYFQKIKDGSVIVGKWIRLVYERIISDLERKAYFFDQKKANAAIDWIESHCFHTEGVLAPGALKLELWQKAFISCLFGLVDEDGQRVYGEVLLLIGRKNGKSAMAAAIAEYLWREGQYGTKIYCLAPKLEQADIVYNNIWQMCELDPEYQEAKEIASEKDMHNKRVNDTSMLPRRRQSDLCIPGNNSIVKKIAANVRRSDGFNPSCCIADEIAAWEGDKGLKQYEVMRSGMGARGKDGLMLSMTTSGYVNDSIFDELMKRSTRFLLGDSKETRLLPMLYMIDNPDKWNDINELRKANPNLGVSIPVSYMLEEISIAEGSLSKKSEFLCKYACLKQNSSLAWLPAKAVEKMCGAPLNMEDFRQCYAVCGVDLSQVRDLTACVAVLERKEEFYIFAQFFLPREKIDIATQRDGIPYEAFIKRGLLTPSGEEFVDYNDCYHWFEDLIDNREIYPLKTGYDRYSAQYLVQQCEHRGMHMDDVYQGDNLWGIIQTVQGYIEEGRIHIGDNDLLKIHLLDAAIKMSAERNRGKLVKVRPSAHIDGVAALLDAFTVREKYYDEIGERLKNE